MVTNVSEEHTGSIFRVEVSQVVKIIQNIGTHSATYQKSVKTAYLIDTLLFSCLKYGLNGQITLKTVSEVFLPLEIHIMIFKNKLQKHQTGCNCKCCFQCQEQGTWFEVVVLDCKNDGKHERV
jgi:hypothetical protein